MEFGTSCNRTYCIVNIIAVKIFKVIYALVVKLRAAGLDAYVSDIIPGHELDKITSNFLRPNGFNRAMVFDYRYPRCKLL